MWPNGAGTPSGVKILSFVFVRQSACVTSYRVDTERSPCDSISSVYAPPFPALIETGGKTDTQSAAHARCVPETLQSARIFLILSRRVQLSITCIVRSAAKRSRKPELREATQGTKSRFRVLVGDHYPNEKSRAPHAPFPRYRRSTDPFCHRGRRTEPKPSGRGWAPEQRDQSLRLPPNDKPPWVSRWPVNSFTEGEAKSRIEKMGFSNVSSLNNHHQRARRGRL